MAKLLRLAGVHVFALLMWSGAPAHAAELQVVTEERPPRQMMQGDKVVGVATAKVRSILEAADIPHSLRLYPFARSFDMAKSTENVCIFSVARTKEREGLFEWIEPPIMQIKRVFLARSDANITVNSLEDARKYRIGTYNGDVMDTYLKSLNMNVQTAPADVNNLSKLVASRIDLWVDDEMIARYLIEQNKEKTPIRTVYTLQTLDVYLACNPRTEPELLARLRQAARQVK
ncbi:MAG TPA: transporter substrate-binding domain-containing protein [Burkholderiaceae bacterium]|nr:transporter substrate-binding domain-containing protein [Burkholderiaceae bacterium]